MALWLDVIEVASILALGAGVVVIWFWLFRSSASEPGHKFPRLRTTAELCIGIACFGLVILSLIDRFGGS